MSYADCYSRVLRYGAADNHTHADFLRKIAENPSELTSSLAFADWLGDSGHDGSGDLVRDSAHAGSNGPLHLSATGVRNREYLDRERREVGVTHDGPFAHVWQYGSNPGPVPHYMLTLHYPHPSGDGYLRYAASGDRKKMASLLYRMTDVPNAAAEAARNGIHPDDAHASR